VNILLLFSFATSTSENYARSADTLKSVKSDSLMGNGHWNGVCVSVCAYNYRFKLNLFSIELI